MILLSGGHNPSSVGASYAGFDEYPNTLIWAYNIKDKLDEYGVPCKVIPTGPLSEKVRYINETDAGESPVWLAVEIHFNAGGGEGSETLYCPGSVKGAAFAKAVNTPLAAVFGRDRGIKEGWYRMDKPKQVDFTGDVEGDEQIDYFLSATRCPAIIVEPEFVERHTAIIAKKEEACSAIADAIFNEVHSNL